MKSKIRQAKKRYAGLVVVLSILAFSGCKWDKRLPFEGNTIDPRLEGFWMRDEPDLEWKQRMDSVGVEELIQFMREGDYCYRVRLMCPFDACGKVVRVGKEPVFTKQGHLYSIKAIDMLPYYMAATSYWVREDNSALTIGAASFSQERYVRVEDTSEVDWAVRRIMKKQGKGNEGE